MSEFKNELFHKYIRGKMNRRQFVTTMAAAGISASAVNGMMVGKARAGSPKKGWQACDWY
jgi:peptide/nickel transport system substrate-binding protein